MDQDRFPVRITPDDIPAFCTRQQAAWIWQVTERTVDNLLRRNAINVVRVGRSIRIPREQILKGAR